MVVQTGFEFKKRRAFPIIEGVVVAAENEAVLLEVFILVISVTHRFAKLAIHPGLLGSGTRSGTKGSD
jgi:Rad4 beta-hairpin domain 3